MTRRTTQCAMAHLLSIAAAALLPLAAGAQSTALKSSVAAAPNIVKFGPNLSVAALAGRPDTDLVEFSDGRRVRVGDVRRLEAAIQKARAAHGPNLLPALSRKPEPTGAPINNASDVAAALKRADQDTVVLPSGRHATVAQLRVAQVFAEKQKGRSTTAVSARPNLAGPAIKVTPQTDFKALMSKPDDTVLESPKGTRVTVGEIKQHFAQKGKTPVRR